MPMLCPICGYVEHSKEDTCAKCGSAMRYSLLAGLEIDEDGHRITLRTDGLPTWNDRINQVLTTTLYMTVLAAIFAFAAVFCIAISPIPVSTVTRDHPALFLTIAACVVLLATSIAARSRLKGVYLAQGVGLATGLLGASVLTALRIAIGIPTIWQEWLIVPIAGAVGFAAGLRVTGNLDTAEEIELKPIHSWDRSTTASEIELRPPAMRRWRRLAAGIAVGSILIYMLPAFLNALLSPFARSSTLMDLSMNRADLLLFSLATFGAGMLAGSGTRSGLVQGLFAGPLSLIVVHVLTPYASQDEVMLKLVLAALTGAAGGVLGRRIFKPYRVYGNATVRNSQSSLPAHTLSG